MCSSFLQNEEFSNDTSPSVEQKFLNEVISKVGESNALLKPITSNSAPCTQESKVVKYDNVISPGMFRINHSKTSRVIQIYLWCIDSGCSKHMTGNIKLLINFIWKFLGTVLFGNDHIAAFLGYGDLQWANILITRVYFVEGLGDNMFSQNGVIERRNRTLVEAARTMLIFSCAPLFLWAEAIATACYTQDRSIIHYRFGKTPFELINGRKPDISFLHVFGALCYPKNDHEDIGKLGVKGDIGFFIGYSANSCAYRGYNQRTKKIMETITSLLMRF
nr:retrovirus-related Pol polyprotein from transposon TNT 1-94 [Tanacetum cinerariifolium]